MKTAKTIICVCAASAMFVFSSFTMAGCSENSGNEVILRVCNWEEYIDLGDWDETERIDVTDDRLCPDGILGENSMVDDFTEWFNRSHDFKVKVEYSTFGTNEDLYNRLSLGDTYDLVCPSDYMIIKLINEGKVLPYSPEFFDTADHENYYVNNVSEYIDGIFTDYGWDEYAACYMWGTTGIVYNPEIVPADDVSTWEILKNDDYNRQVTIKDNVRDAYFVTLGMMNTATLTDLSDSDEDHNERSKILNDTDSETIANAQEVLKQIKENVYSFETDSGKADMVTGKVVANYQWSGDAVYILDEADGDESMPVELWYSVPDECSNLWFDGWIMLKDGISGNEQRQEAAEAFVNFLSRPDSAIRNMYYIGYTSSIAGDLVYDYMDWNYGFVFDPADEEYFDETVCDVYEYDLSYFFGEGYAPLYIDAGVVEIDADAGYTVEKLGEEYGNDMEYNVFRNADIRRGRQLFAQYPTQSVITRSVVMLDFGDKLSEINQMWINVRCLDLLDINPAVIGIIAAIIAVIAIIILLYCFRYKLFIKNKPRNGYEKI